MFATFAMGYTINSYSSMKRREFLTMAAAGLPMPPLARVLRSPKDEEFVRSLHRTPRVSVELAQVLPITPKALAPGARLSITQGPGLVTISWAGGNPSFSLERKSRDGAWEFLMGPTLERSVTLATFDMDCYFRVREAIPMPLEYEEVANGVRLTWTPPQPNTTAMGDNIVHYRLETRNPDVTQTWSVLQASLAPTIQSDASKPIPNFTVTPVPAAKADYRVIGVTATGQEIPSAIANISNVEPGSVAFVKRFGSDLTDGGDVVLVDPLDRTVVLIAHFKGTANFGGQNLVATPGYVAMAVARYDRNGNHIWSTSFSAAGDVNITGAAIGQNGSIHICGYHNGSANFGGSTFTVASGALLNAYIVKLNGSGAHQWSNSFGSTQANKQELFTGIAVDSSGNSFVVGTMQGRCSFGGSQVSTQYGDYQTTQVLLCKYNSSGVHQFSKTFPGHQSGSEGLGIALDSTGKPIITGAFFYEINFAANDSLDRTIRAGNQTFADCFVVKFTSAGLYVWSWRRGGSRDNSDNSPPPPPKTYSVGSRGLCVAVDSNDDVIVGGSYNQEGDFGGGLVPRNGVNNAFIAKYRGIDGGWIWNYQWYSPSDLAGPVKSISTDADRNVIAGGFWSFTITINGYDYLYSGNYDGILVKLTSSGVLRWFKLHQSSTSEGYASVFVDKVDGTIFGTSGFTGGTTWKKAVTGGNPPNDTQVTGTPTSQSFGDTFLVKINP